MSHVDIYEMLMLPVNFRGQGPSHDVQAPTCSEGGGPAGFRPYQTRQLSPFHGLNDRSPGPLVQQVSTNQWDFFRC